MGTGVLSVRGRRLKRDRRVAVTGFRLGTGFRLTIALITDFHDRPAERILRLVAAQRPDLIAVAGDLIDGYEMMAAEPAALQEWQRMPRSVFRVEKNALSLLYGLVRIAPTYYGLGNHEWFLSGSDYQRIKRTGVTLLDNAFTEAIRLPSGKPVCIGGLTSATIMRYRAYLEEYPERKGYYPIYEKHHPHRWWARPMTMPRLDYGFLDAFEQADGYKILLCHHPEYWTVRPSMLASRRIDLTLSGHAHGGQIRLFGRGVFAPGQGLFPYYTAGLHRRGNNRLIISRGLANTTWVPRIANQPELVVIRCEA